MMEKLDLKRYQTTRLVEQVSDTLEVGAAIFTIFQSVTLITGSLFLAANLVLFFGGASWTTWAMLALYVLLIGGLLGVAIGVVRVFRNFVSQSATIMYLLVGVTRQAKTDLASLRSGQAELPSNSEIMLHAYQDVILPTVQQVILKSGSVLSRVLFWLYQRTTERNVLRGMQTDPGSGAGSAAAGSGPEASSPQVELLKTIEAMASPNDEEIGATVRSVAWLRTTILRIQRWVLIPLQVVFWLVAAAAIVPVFMTFWLSR